MKAISVMVIIALLFTGCASGPRPDRLVARSDATPPPQEESKAGKIILGLVLLPLVIPVLALAAVASGPGGGYGGGVSCKSKIYADGTKVRTSCY
jgi:hypothetical protein